MKIIGAAGYRSKRRGDLFLDESRARILQSIPLTALLSVWLSLVLFAVIPGAYHAFTPAKDLALIYGSLLLSPLALYLFWREPISNNRRIGPWVFALLLLSLWAAMLPRESFASPPRHTIESLRLTGLALSAGMASLLALKGSRRALLQIWIGLGWLQALLVLLQAVGLDPFYFITGSYGTWRIYGTIGNPNLVASFLVPLFFLTQWPLLVPHRKLRSLALALLALAIIATGSRASALILVLGLFIQLGLFYQKKGSTRANPWRYLLYSAILLGTFGVGSLMGKGFASIGGRLFFWQSSLELIKRQPWIGYGLGHFQGVYLKGAALLASNQAPLAIPTHAHNDYLEFAVELGLIFPLILILSALWALKVAWSCGLSHLSLALGAMALYGAWDSSLHAPPIALLFWMLLSLAPPPSKKLLKTKKQLPPAIILSLLLAMMGAQLLWGLPPTYNHMKAHYIGGAANDLALKGEWEEATDLFGKAFALSPGDGVFAYWLSQGLAARGEREEALEVAREAAKTYARFHLYLLLAQLERNYGDREEAISILEQLLAGFPQHQEAQQLLEVWDDI